MMIYRSILKCSELLLIFYLLSCVICEYAFFSHFYILHTKKGKRLWCWKRLKAGGEGDDRGWDGCMASPTQWTWVWANSRRWWRTGKPGPAAVHGATESGMAERLNNSNSILHIMNEILNSKTFYLWFKLKKFKSYSVALKWALERPPWQSYG